jgi:hypothetical protein
VLWMSHGSSNANQDQQVTITLAEKRLIELHSI